MSCVCGAIHTKKGRKCMSRLNWKILTKKRGSSTQGVPPGKEDLAWVTNTVTLIYGDRDAVLVDTFLSEQQSKELLDWIVESGRNLATIYVTHAHGVLDPDSSPRHIEETRRYIQDFNAAVASRSTRLELYEKMLSLHPNRVNPGSLWAAAKAAKPS